MDLTSLTSLSLHAQQAALAMSEEEAMAGALAGVLVIGIVVGLAVWLIPTIFYCLSMSKCLRSVPEGQRKLSPGLVWLLLIPLFNLVWNFFVVARVSGSLEAGAKSAGKAIDGNGWGVGLTFCILSACSILPIPLINFLVAVGALVCWIIWWIKAVGLRKHIYGA